MMKFKMMLPLLFILSLTTAAIVEDKDITLQLDALPDCICVSPAECVNGEVITAGQNLVRVRSAFGETECNSSQIMCLAVPENEIVDGKTKDICAKLNRRDYQPTVNGIVNGTEDKEVGEGEVHKPQCGMSFDEETNDRMADFGPEEAGIGEFPWTVMIYRTVKPVTWSKAVGKEMENITYRGVGSLIGPRAVLTIAHKFSRRENRANLFVRAGSSELHSEDLVYPYQDSNVMRVIIHDDYDSGRKANDVALFILEAAIHPADTVGFVCLPPAARAPEIGTPCFLSGWGSNETLGPVSKRQMMLELPIVDNQECMAAYRNRHNMNAKYRLPQSTMCAKGEEGVEACKGWGGAPLVCPYSPGSIRFYQAGIAIWGIECGKARAGIYYSLSHARAWIDRQMTAHGLPIDTYTAPEDQP